LRRISRWSWGSVILLAILVAGCATGPEKLEICPGKASVEEALSALEARAEKAQPLRVNGGRCRLVYYESPEDEKPKRHNLSPRLWFQPPSKIYIQLSVGVDQKAVIIGCNDESFWMGMRPQEVSSYYWGNWADAQDVDGLMVGPKVVLEAFGIIQRGEAGDSSQWSLTNDGPYDILTLKTADGRLVKRVYIYCCDYLVRKIEYFDTKGELVAVAELGDYESVVEGFDVPKKIYVSAIAADGRADELEIKLYDPKVKELSPRAQQIVFNRKLSDVNDYENVYRYENGGWVAER